MVRQQFYNAYHLDNSTQTSLMSNKTNETLTKTTTMNSLPILFLVGVSGGCDSVALFHLLRQFVAETQSSSSQQQQQQQQQQPLMLMHVIHFDHQQRGAESDADRYFVMNDLCRAHGIPATCYFWKDHAAENSQFSQELARDWRRTYMARQLQELVKERNDQVKQQEEDSNKVGSSPNILLPTAGVILTAHHSDDSNESMLLKLLRGAHITHLSGMEPIQVLSPDTGRVTDCNLPILLARPLLSLSKRELIDYLQAHSDYSWREDKSNQSNKYLRNRVRNELVPLLQHLTNQGSVSESSLFEKDNTNVRHDATQRTSGAIENALQKRLNHLSEQSRELKLDLEQRANEYLNQNGMDAGDTFFLPANEGGTNRATLGLVEKQALHMWTERVSNGSLYLTYEQLKRVCEQLNAHPNNRRWRLNLGDRWDIERIGDALRLVSCHDSADPSQLTGALTLNSVDTPLELPWTVANSVGDDYAIERNGKIRICIPSSLSIDNCHLCMVPSDQLNKYNEIFGFEKTLLFTPPWRRGRSPIKVTEFLRGQKVPLHLRERARVIILSQTFNATRDGFNATRDGATSAARVVAVHIPTKNEWIVDDNFEATGTNKDGLVVFVEPPLDEQAALKQ